MEASVEGCGISRGHGGAFSIDTRPTLCSWGANGHGQLGQGHTDDLLVPVAIKPELTPKEVEQTEVSHIGGGGGFSFIVTGVGHLLTCGNNDRGQLGLDEASPQRDNDSNTPRRPIVNIFTLCTSLSKVRVKKAASGWDFMLALTDNGSVYSWGSNSFGQLGRHLDETVKAKQTSVPSEISFPTRGPQTDIAAGLRHGLSVSVEGHVFAWGHGKKGQLGSDVKDATGGKSFFVLPQQVPGVGKAKSVFAGMYHSGILDDTSSVLMWGCNAYGQCGVSPEAKTRVNVPSKQHIPCKDDEYVVSVCSGWTHLVARTNQGNLYSWGRSNLGQLGRLSPGSGCDPSAVLLDGLTKVTQHACGSEHNIALSESNKVYTWGWNEHGICATGNEADVPLPRKVTSIPVKDDKDVHTQTLRSDNVIFQSVGCGAGHTFTIIMQHGADI